MKRSIGISSYLCRTCTGKQKLASLKPSLMASAPDVQMCSYVGHVDYTDEMMRDVLLDSIADIDIRREALSADANRRSERLES